MSKIKLNPPYEGELLDNYYPFEKGSLKAKAFGLLVANTDLLLMPTKVTFSILAEACDSTPEDIEKALTELEMEFQTGDLVQ